MSSIKILNGVIDIFKVAPDNETIIIRGVLDPESLCDIRVDSYQREVIPGARADDLKKALKTSTVPDIELGMRGERHQVREGKKGEGDTFFLQDDVFVIDGLQRISAGKKLIAEDADARPRIGCVVHLNTTKDWECERFRILNQDRLKLNSNVLLRNARSTSPAMDMLYHLTEDDSFVLHRKIQWSQRKARTELLTAMVLCQVVGFLHSRFGPGRGTDISMVKSLDVTLETVGRTTMRDNLKTFFDVLDECFGLRRVIYSHSAIFLRRAFLVSLADLFTRHTNFWRGNRLFVEKDLKAKIAKFPLNDPSVVQLASSGGKAREILYQILLDHVNSGKRTRRLIPVDGMIPKAEVPKEDSVPETELIEA